MEGKSQQQHDGPQGGVLEHAVGHVRMVVVPVMVVVSLRKLVKKCSNLNVIIMIPGSTTRSLLADWPPGDGGGAGDCDSSGNPLLYWPGQQEGGGN